MATNSQSGKGRKGAIMGRSQFLNPLYERFVKRDTKTGKILNVKDDTKPFKGVRKEK